ncbi:growth factor, putative [Trichomonas vaginalis G3]|nr:growth factor 2 [Trichomonas vaginalis G3]ALJ75590.1 growth factor 1 [Trichomonas vaginalis]EAY03945.1 growth factor, putative [Trichomonas vaginalis G3]KAI5541035.1 growth factor 2 [Trichomonas vaginalis G3]|eukprot:XP_001316168.1 growth factor [Trichomonas vaginalis G3]
MGVKGSKLGDDEDVDLDEMFDNIKKAKKEKVARDAALKEAMEKSKQKRRYTEDGLPIFTEAELKMDNPKAGTTPLCPFDCDCCF